MNPTRDSFSEHLHALLEAHLAANPPLSIGDAIGVLEIAKYNLLSAAVHHTQTPDDPYFDYPYHDDNEDL